MFFVYIKEMFFVYIKEICRVHVKCLDLKKKRKFLDLLNIELLDILKIIYENHKHLHLCSHVEVFGFLCSFFNKKRDK